MTEAKVGLDNWAKMYVPSENANFFTKRSLGKVAKSPLHTPVISIFVSETDTPPSTEDAHFLIFFKSVVKVGFSVRE